MKNLIEKQFLSSFAKNNSFVSVYVDNPFYVEIEFMGSNNIQVIDKMSKKSLDCLLGVLQRASEALHIQIILNTLTGKKHESEEAAESAIKEFQEKEKCNDLAFEVNSYCQNEFYVRIAKKLQQNG